MSSNIYKKIGSVEDRVQEECAELIQAISKVKRFGWWRHPTKGGLYNFEEVEREINDVELSIKELKEKLNNIRRSTP